MLMTGEDYRESLRRYSPRVFVDGDRVESVADEPRLAPGVAAVGLTYDLAFDERYSHLMTARETTTGETVNRMVHIDRTPQDLIEKLEASRLVCREVGCAQRYLVGDRITEADWRAFTTLVRFDPVYVGHFKCNIRRLADYPNLWAFTRELYQIPGVAETVSLEHIKRHYYGSHKTINPSGVVPLGPDINFTAPHGRERLDAA